MTMASEFNACPVVRVNINEYDLHDDPDSLTVSSINQTVIDTYRNVDQRQH